MLLSYTIDSIDDVVDDDKHLPGTSSVISKTIPTYTSKSFQFYCELICQEASNPSRSKTRYDKSDQGITSILRSKTKPLQTPKTSLYKTFTNPLSPTTVTEKSNIAKPQVVTTTLMILYLQLLTV